MFIKLNEPLFTLYIDGKPIKGKIKDVRINGKSLNSEHRKYGFDRFVKYIKRKIKQRRKK